MELVFWLMIVTTQNGTYGKAIHTERFMAEKHCRAVLADIEKQSEDRRGMTALRGICVAVPIK